MNEGPIREIRDTYGKRQAILAAAARVFTEKGFHAAKIEEIAQAADVGKGTVYEYFANKKALFEEMLMEAVRSYESGLAAASRQENTAVGALTAMLQFSLSFLQEKRGLARLLLEQPVGMSANLKKWLREERQSIASHVEQAIRVGINSGEIRPLEPELAVYFFFGVVNGVYGQSLYTGEALTEQSAHEAMELLLHGIGAS